MLFIIAQCINNELGYHNESFTDISFCTLTASRGKNKQHPTVCLDTIRTTLVTSLAMCPLKALLLFFSSSNCIWSKIIQVKVDVKHVVVL